MRSAFLRHQRSARRGHTRLENYDGAYSDVRAVLRLLMLHTHSGSSRRAFFDTSLRCGTRVHGWDSDANQGAARTGSRL